MVNVDSYYKLMCRAYLNKKITFREFKEFCVLRACALNNTWLASALRSEHVPWYFEIIARESLRLFEKR